MEGVAEKSSGSHSCCIQFWTGSRDALRTSISDKSGLYTGDRETFRTPAKGIFLRDAYLQMTAHTMTINIPMDDNKNLKVCLALWKTLNSQNSFKYQVQRCGSHFKTYHTATSIPRLQTHTYRLMEQNRELGNENCIYDQGCRVHNGEASLLVGKAGEVYCYCLFLFLHKRISLSLLSSPSLALVLLLLTHPTCTFFF